MYIHFKSTNEEFTQQIIMNTKKVTNPDLSWKVSAPMKFVSSQISELICSAANLLQQGRETISDDSRIAEMETWLIAIPGFVFLQFLLHTHIFLHLYLDQLRLKTWSSKSSFIELFFLKFD